MVPRIKEKCILKAHSELDVFRSAANRQDRRELHYLRQIQARNPNGQLIWLDGQISNPRLRIWLVNGQIPNSFIHQPWVVGRLSIIERRIRRVPLTGMLLWMEKGLEVDVQNWLVCGNLAFVREAIRVANSQQLDPATHLDIVARMYYGQRDSNPRQTANETQLERNRTRNVRDESRNQLTKLEARTRTDFIKDRLFELFFVVMIPVFVILLLIFYPKDKLMMRRK